MQQVSELLRVAKGFDGSGGGGVFHYIDFLFRILHSACNLQICSTLATSFPKLAPAITLEDPAARWLHSGRN